MRPNDADGSKDKGAVLRRYPKVLLLVPVGNPHLVLKGRQHQRSLVQPSLGASHHGRQRLGQRRCIRAKTQQTKRRGRGVYPLRGLGRCLVHFERRSWAPRQPRTQALWPACALGGARSIVVELLGLVQGTGHGYPRGWANVGHRLGACHRRRHQLSGFVMFAKLHQRQLTFVRRVDRQLEQRLCNRRRWLVRSAL